LKRRGCGEIEVIFQNMPEGCGKKEKTNYSQDIVFPAENWK